MDRYRLYKDSYLFLLLAAKKLFFFKNTDKISFLFEWNYGLNFDDLSSYLINYIIFFIDDSMVKTNDLIGGKKYEKISIHPIYDSGLPYFIRK